MIKRDTPAPNFFMAAPILKFKLLTPSAKLPTYAHDDDAGFDLYSVETKIIRRGGSHAVRLGIASEIPKGWHVEIKDRSSLAVKYDLHNLAGIIDTGYRGEWLIVVKNLGGKSYKIEKGDRIGQGILLPSMHAKIVKADKLSETKRGEGGFGSTGRK